MPKFPRSVAILFGALGLCAAPLVVLPVSSASAAALTAADTDKDGTIDLTEAKAAASAEFDKLDKDKDGTLDLKEVAHVSKANFSAANPDNDKTLTKDEYLALVAKLFQAADKEGDGTINSKELHSKAGIALDTRHPLIPVHPKLSPFRATQSQGFAH